MKARTILLVVLAIICGGSAAVGVNQMRRNALDNAKTTTKPVVTAISNAPRGVLLTEEMVTVEPWPEDHVPTNAIGSVDDVVDRVVLVPIVQGEPILNNKLAGKDAGRGLAAMIPKGMRAFTIRTPHESAGVGGFILPGNHVDVLLTTNGSGLNDTTGGGASTTLLQNVEVLAVAQRLDAPDENKVDPKEVTSVTLLVTPDQAAKLDLGMNKGILHLALRNPEDNGEADTRPATMAQLRFHQEPPHARPTIDPETNEVIVLAEAPQQPAAAVAVATAEATATPADDAPKQRRRAAQIHTLRGTQRGHIQLEW